MACKKDSLIDDFFTNINQRKQILKKKMIILDKMKVVQFTIHVARENSVIVQEDENALFFAGDTSYTQQLMLLQAIDGVAADEALALQTLQRILEYTKITPTVYLPSHDPEAAQRLTARKECIESSHS